MVVAVARIPRLTNLLGTETRSGGINRDFLECSIIYFPPISMHFSALFLLSPPSLPFGAAGGFFDVAVAAASFGGAWPFGRSFRGARSLMHGERSAPKLRPQCAHGNN